MNRIRLPYILDIEASGLGNGSYPIEVGLALEPGDRYCSLILPAEGWNHWDEQAEALHQISRETLLTCGRPIADVARDMNRLLDGKVVYSDAWGVDNVWVIELFTMAGVRQRFTVSPIEMILTEKQIDIWSDTRDTVVSELGLRRHRASNDSWIIQETYVRTLAMASSQISEVKD